MPNDSAPKINPLRTTSFRGDMPQHRTPASTVAATKGVEVVYYVMLDTGRVKIGTSADFINRLHRHGLPGMRNKDRVLALEFGGRALERERHLQFAHLRHGKTEQFTPAPDLDAHIDQLREALHLVD